jgi:hypothetical protein
MSNEPQQLQDVYHAASTIEHRHALDVLVAELLQKHHLTIRLSRVL